MGGGLWGDEGTWGGLEGMARVINNDPSVMKEKRHETGDWWPDRNVGGCRGRGGDAASCWVHLCVRVCVFFSSRTEVDCVGSFEH